jgi:hypothetical protein
MNVRMKAAARLITGVGRSRSCTREKHRRRSKAYVRPSPTVNIRLVHVPDHALPDEAGETIWSSRQPVDKPARVVVRVFDAVANRSRGRLRSRVVARIPPVRTRRPAQRVAHRPQRHNGSSGRIQILGRLKPLESRRTGGRRKITCAVMPRLAR